MIPFYPTPGEFLPLPPDYIIREYGRPARPMKVNEARHWAESFNRWVEKWNRHECDVNLPLSPDWDEATDVHIFGPKSAIGFEVPGLGLGIMRIAGYSPFHGGWSFCRNPVDAERIL